MDPTAITYFGETDARNKRVKFGIKAKDRLRHVYVIGKTGMGKSTLLENMAIQDIQNGNGIAFIDPHGGTVEKLLDYVPEHRVKDVVYFAPFDLEYPVSFNVLEDVGPDKRHLVVNGLMATFEKIWVDAWSARMAYILTNTLLALLEYPGATLLGVNRMLTDKEFRKKVVDNIKDPSVKIFWVDEFGKWTEKFIAEAIPAIQNKVGQFTANPLVRNLLGQPKSSFDIRQMMDDSKIIIINMSKGLVGEGNARLIGSMLITKMYLAAMSRADRSEKELAKLPNFYLYVDEFQSFANKSFADILSEARKYKLNLTIAHQYIEQMEEEVRDAVFGNVGTMIAYRVGAFDAEVLEKEFAPTFTAENLVNLGMFQMYLKLMIDGVSSQPFSAKGMTPIPRPEIMFKDAVIASSRAQFARPRADVEKDILNWHDEGTAKDSGRDASRDQGRDQNRDFGNNRDAGRDGNRDNSRDFRQPTHSPNQAPQQKWSQNYSASATPRYESRSFERSSEPRREEPRREPQPVAPRTEQRPERVERVEPQTPVVDENKKAFALAAEIIKQKSVQSQYPSQVERQPVQSIPPTQRTESHTELRVEPKPISLLALKPEDKKNPSQQNISSLKDALSKMVTQAKITPTHTPTQTQTPSPASTPISSDIKTEKPSQHSHHKPHVAHAVEKKPEVKEKENREIPEKVLREVLTVEKK